MLKQITLLTNICFEPYWSALVKERFSHSTKDIKFNSILYEDYYDNIEDIKFSDLIVVCLNFEMLYIDISNEISSKKVTNEDIEKDCINKCKNLYSYLKSNSKASIIWFGFEDFYCLQSKNQGSLLFFNGLIDKLNFTLNDIIQEDTFIDFKRLIATVGMKNAYDIKGKYRWNAPYTNELIMLMIEEIEKQYSIVTGNTKKCLVLDCDGVLWGGVLSENGIESIKIGGIGEGRWFEDFQRYLLDLYYHGVILSICSKNDEVDVLRVFTEHTGMILKEEHIACFKCNWDNKVDNIKDISKSLNIGLDSMVFVDDSVFEIESVKTILPQVTTVLLKKDNIYNKLACFNLKRDIDIETVSERMITYKTNRLRCELQKNTESYEKYISSLNTVVDIHNTLECELVRITELTQRTNKCTNGIRYTFNQIKKMISLGNYELYTVCISDRFSDLGVVGVIGIKEGILDLFCLSCRAIGRKLEENMIKFIERKISKVQFRSTGKNKEIEILFNSYGLEICE